MEALDAPPRHAGPAQEEFASRLEANRASAAAAARRCRVLSNCRLLCFLVVVGLVIAVGVWDVSGHWLWAPLAAFVALVTFHARASQRQVRGEQAVALYEQGLARLAGDWIGRGYAGLTWRPADHVYADDLDLFGRGSLFERVCAARTPTGRERLASWLLAPAAPDEIRRRQSAIEELRPNVDFREALALVQGEIATALEHSAASPWAQAPLTLQSRVRPRLHLVSGVVSTILLVGWLAAGWSPVWMLAAMAVQGILAALDRSAVQAVLEAADRPAKDLALLGRILEPIETATFQGEGLRALQERLTSKGKRPSDRIHRLVRLMDFVEARLNQIFLPVSWLLSLGTQLAYAIEAWRRDHGDELGTWIDVVAELEALASLSGYAYEHPQDPFPEILEDECALEGVGLGHPLLADTACVRNDVSLKRPAEAGTSQAFVVSGSNMSGKSTLLRTIGANAVLAFAGAPVRAVSLRIAPLALGASIRVQDSLQEGASRFYAEIGRLKRIVDISRGDGAALFLLDEILHGTNSHDRRIGAAAVVKTLLDEGALGLVTTHDLALATMAEQNEDRLANVHFADHMEDDRIAFDYRLRRGVVEHSNALALMRAVGLDVEDQ